RRNRRVEHNRVAGSVPKKPPDPASRTNPSGRRHPAKTRRHNRHKRPPLRRDQTRLATSLAARFSLPIGGYAALLVVEGCNTDVSIGSGTLNNRQREPSPAAGLPPRARRQYPLQSHPNTRHSTKSPPCTRLGELWKFLPCSYFFTE